MRGVKTMLFISLFTLPLFLWGCEKKEDVFSGTIEGNEIYIQAEIGGILDAIHVKEGDAVEKGQALIQLDEQPQDLLVRERKAAADAAKIKLEEAKAGEPGARDRPRGSGRAAGRRVLPTEN